MSDDLSWIAGAIKYIEAHLPLLSGIALFLAGSYKYVRYQMTRLKRVEEKLDHFVKHYATKQDVDDRIEACHNKLMDKMEENKDDVIEANERMIDRIIELMPKK